MSYDFKTLSWADFEDLCRDLLGKSLTLRFEAFSSGPDGGMDGRNSAGGRKVVLQAKHYAGSPIGSLMRSMRAAQPTIAGLAPTRYLLATSRPLTPKNKVDLAKIIGAPLRDEGDLFGPADLNGLLRRYPDIERAHVKLWLSSSAVLDRILHAAMHAFTSISTAEIESKVRVYATNPSFAEARKKLEKHHVLIVTGPPGVGKSTLAEMTAYAYLAEGWQLVVIRSLDDGFTAIADTAKQVFLFDDFLGKVALDRASLASKDSELARFVTRTRKSPNARFILTTRTNIFEEARRLSETLADRRLDVEKYALDVGVYTRRTRARILYNHLLVAGTPITHVGALIRSGKIPHIVDHKNYNPRIIEWMTDAFRIQEIDPAEYADAFLLALKNPSQLWENAFNGLPRHCQHLLYALFFCSEYGCEISVLEGAFDSVHTTLSSEYRISFGPTDFEEALRVLEGGFITISGRTVTFVNPSLRDYLTKHLNSAKLLRLLASCAPTPSWARALWRHGKAENVQENRALAKSFLESATAMSSRPSRRDLDVHDETTLWLDLWSACWDARYAQLASKAATSRFSHAPPWVMRWVVQLIDSLNSQGEYEKLPNKNEIVHGLENIVLEALEGGMGWDDLDALAEEIESHPESLGHKIAPSLYASIARDVAEIDQYISEVDSEQQVEDDIKVLKRWASKAGVSNANIENAVLKMERRKERIFDETEEASAPSVTGKTSDPEAFDNVALKNLFETLVPSQ